MIVDFRTDPAPLPSVILCDSPVTSAESFRFLGTTITKELKWEQNIRSLTKKAQQRMYFLQELKKFLLPVKMLVNFYTAIVESFLTSSITVWFAAATARDKAKLQRVIHSAEKVIGCSLPSLQEQYVSRSRRRAAKIAAEPSHPRNELFQSLPSGKRLRSIRTRTSCHKNSFFPTAVSLLNKPLAEQLRREPAFKGLHIPGTGGTRAKLSVYAGDATLFLGRDEDFRAVSGILEAFSDATGARINRSKSAVLYAGAWARRSDIPGGFALCQDGLKILGVVFWREGSAQKNWDIALSKLKARAESWCKRDLSLTGRVVAACSDLLAGLHHLALVFPIPFLMGRRLECTLFMFIWGGE
ncbi:hypothetical protein QTP86_034668 [Hemibagrus guttatus]|nr:hypothetical protein QTP86_034668 [Hemibagrus guttatus]